MDAICEGEPLRGDGNYLLTITPRWAWRPTWGYDTWHLHHLGEVSPRSVCHCSINLDFCFIVRSVCHCSVPYAVGLLRGEAVDISKPLQLYYRWNLPFQYANILPFNLQNLLSLFVEKSPSDIQEIFLNMRNLLLNMQKYTLILAFGYWCMGSCINIFLLEMIKIRENYASKNFTFSVKSPEKVS
jgi:hypothetical protein